MMLAVVPKKKYIKLENELEYYKGQSKGYEKLAGKTIDNNNKLQKDLDEVKESLEIEKSANKRLCEIVQIYESKELSKREKEIARLEKIANRTKSPYTKQKVENRILKINENDIKRGLYEDK